MGCKLYRPIHFIYSQQIIIPLPTGVQSYAVQLSWWQLAEREIGAFAIDDILLGPSTYSFGSSYKDTYVTDYAQYHCLK